MTLLLTLLWVLPVSLLLTLMNVVLVTFLMTLEWGLLPVPINILNMSKVNTKDTRRTTRTYTFLACFSHCVMDLLKLEFMKCTRLISLNVRLLVMVAKCFSIKSHLVFTS